MSPHQPMTRPARACLFGSYYYYFSFFPPLRCVALHGGEYRTRRKRARGKRGGRARYHHGLIAHLGLGTNKQAKERKEEGERLPSPLRIGYLDPFLRGPAFFAIFFLLLLMVSPISHFLVDQLRKEGLSDIFAARHYEITLAVVRSCTVLEEKWIFYFFSSRSHELCSSRDYD